MRFFYLLLLLVPLVSSQSLHGTWKSHVRVPSARQLGHVFTIGVDMYLLGGTASTSSSSHATGGIALHDLWMYNATADQWNLLRAHFDNFPEAHSASLWVLPNGDAYEFGGFDDAFGITGEMVTINLLSGANWLFVKGSRPQARMNAVHWVHNATTLALIGGKTALGYVTDLWFFDVPSGKWTNVPTTGPFALNGMMVGGYVASQKAAYVYITLFQEVWVLNFTTFVWSKVATKGTPPLGALESTMHAISNNKLYLLGGSSVRGFSILYASFDFLTLTWSVKKALPEPRSLSAVLSVLSSGNIYIFGGQLGAGTSNDLLLFNTATDTVKRIRENVANPLPRREHTSTVVGDSIFVFGGFLSQPMKDMWKVSPAFVWSPILTSTEPGARFGHSAWALNEYFYICGGAVIGANSLNLLSDMWRFSMLTNDWEFMSSNTNLRRRMYAPTTTFGGIAYLYGGRLTDHFSRDVWFFDPATGIWDFIAVVGDSRPGSLALAQVVCNGTHIFLFGGLYNSGITNQRVWSFAVGEKKTGSWTDIGPISKHQANGHLLAITPLSSFPMIRVIISDFADAKQNTSRLTFWQEGQETIPMGRNWIGKPPSSLGTVQMIGKHLVYIAGQSATSHANENLDYIRLECTNPNVCFVCNHGLYKTSSGCEFCAAGTYTDKEDMTECIPCPQGTFGTLAGSSTLAYCIPCPAGTFANMTGQTSCFPCKTDNADLGGKLTCAKGASYPHLTANKVERQVHDYLTTETKKTDLEYTTDVVGYGTLMVIALAVMIFIFYVLVPSRLPDWLQHADVLCWDNHANMCEEKYVLSLKTALGGLVSITLLFTTLVLITTVLVRPIHDPTSISQKIIIKEVHTPLSALLSVTVTMTNAVFKGPTCECLDGGTTLAFTGRVKVFSCTTLNVTTCVARFEAIVSTGPTDSASLVFLTNAAPGAVSVELKTEISADDEPDVLVQTYTRTQHAAAKMVEHATFNYEVLVTHLTNARHSGKTDNSGWNLRNTDVAVGKENIVMSGQTSPETARIVLNFKQLKNEIHILEQVNFSTGFVIGILMCIISGVITFGLSLNRVLESWYYRKDPTKAPWIRHYEFGMRLREAVQKRDLQNRHSVDMTSQDPNTLKKESKEYFIPKPIEVTRVTNSFEVADTESLRQTLSREGARTHSRMSQVMTPVQK